MQSALARRPQAASLRPSTPLAVAACFADTFSEKARSPGKRESHIRRTRLARRHDISHSDSCSLSLSLPPPTGCPDPEGGHLAARTPFTGPKAFFQLRVWKPGASLSQGAAGREAARHLLQGPCLAQAARLLSLLHISSLAFSCENPAAAVQESRFSGA